MTNEDKDCYTEVLTVLDQMEPIYMQKIPLKLINFFKENCNVDYKAKIDLNEPLKSQKIKDKTLTLLAILYYNYWCESDEEKQQLANKFVENEISHQNELREKYNPDNVFKNALKATNYNGMDNIKQNMALTSKQQHQKWYKAFFFKLFPFLRK